MLQTFSRYGVPLVALLVLGPIAGWLTYSLHGPDGGPETTLLLCNPVSKGLIAGVGVLAIAAAIGVFGAWANEPRNGLTAAGLVMAWGAWGLGRVDLVLGRVQNGSAMYMIAAEGVFVGVLSVLAATAIFKVKPRSWPKRAETHHHHLEPEPGRLLDSSMPVAFCVALVAAAILGSLIAADTLKGQAFAAAVVAGLGAAAAGRVTSQRVSGAVFVAAVAVLAIAGPAIAVQWHPSMLGPVKAARAGTLFALAKPLPLDWMAGAFCGVPIGLAWAASMVERKHPHHS